MSDLDRLPNLGQTLCQKLSEVGIQSVEALARLGPARAYNRLVQQAGRRLPVCYYLYSLEGALRGRDWRCLNEHEKARLRREAGLPGAPARKPSRAPTTNGLRAPSKG